MPTADLTPRPVGFASGRFTGGTRGPRKLITKPTRLGSCPFGGPYSLASEPWTLNIQGYGPISAITSRMPPWRTRVLVMKCCFGESSNGRSRRGVWKASSAGTSQTTASLAPGLVTRGPASPSVTRLPQWRFGAWLVGNISMKRDVSAVNTSAGGRITSGHTYPGRISWTGFEPQEEPTCSPARPRTVNHVLGA